MIGHELMMLGGGVNVMAVVGVVRWASFSGSTYKVSIIDIISEWYSLRYSSIHYYEMPAPKVVCSRCNGCKLPLNCPSRQ